MVNRSMVCNSILYRFSVRGTLNIRNKYGTGRLKNCMPDADIPMVIAISMTFSIKVPSELQHALHTLIT